MYRPSDWRHRSASFAPFQSRLRREVLAAVRLGSAPQPRPARDTFPVEAHLAAIRGVYVYSENTPIVDGTRCQL